VTFGTVGDGRGTDLSLALPFPVDFFFKPMPTTLPASVRDTLGEEAAVDFARWLDETLQQRTVKRDEYREVLSRLDVLEERFDYVEERFDLMEKRMDERFEQIDQRLEQIDRRFESMEERFDSRLAGMKEEFNGCFETMDAKLDRMNDRILSMTRWLIGLIALFGSLVTALLAVAQFGG